MFDEPRGLRHYDQPFLRNFETAQAEGRAFDEANANRRMRLDDHMLVRAVGAVVVLAQV